MTAGRKRDAVLRLLRGESLEILARETGVTAAELSGWRDAFLEAGAASLKARGRDDRDAAIDRLRIKVGALTIARRSAAIHSRRDRGQEASAGTPSCSRRRSSGSRPVPPHGRRHPRGLPWGWRRPFWATEVEAHPTQQAAWGPRRR